LRPCKKIAKVKAVDQPRHRKGLTSSADTATTTPRNRIGLVVFAEKNLGGRSRGARTGRKTKKRIFEKVVIDHSTVLN
jgi:hypothetical protein